MQSTETNSQLEIEGRIDTKVHDEHNLRNKVDDYENLSEKEKLELARSVEPEYEDTVYNVTTEGLHEYLVDNLNPEQTDPVHNLDAAWLGVGTNSGGGTTTTDTDLNSRGYETQVTDSTSNSTELLSSTFIPSSEANLGSDLNELGLFTGDPSNLSDNDVFLLNHATFANVEKDNTKTITFDVTLSFADN